MAFQSLRDINPNPPYRVSPTCCRSGQQSTQNIYVAPQAMQDYLQDLAATAPEVLRTLKIRPNTETLCYGCMWKLVGWWRELGGRMLTRPQMYRLMGHVGEPQAIAKWMMVDNFTEDGTPLHAKSQEARARHGPPE